MNKLKDILLRYIILLLIPLKNLYLIYAIFTPLTIYASYFLFNISFNAVLLPNGSIIVSGIKIDFIDACIAGAAYYLLLILNLSTPDIKLKKRLKILFLSFLVFFLLNTLRVFLLGIILIVSAPSFDITHKLFWYAGSTIFVGAIWFLEVKLFKIKGIPFYSDIKYLKKQIK